MNNVSIWIAVAALAFSIFGPLLTTIINNRHENEVYKQKFIEEHRHTVIENYLKSAGRFAFTTNYEDMRTFGEASAEIFMYAPKELWEDIKAMNELLTELSRCDDQTGFKIMQPRAQEMYLTLCEKFSNLLRSSKNESKRHRSK